MVYGGSDGGVAWRGDGEGRLDKFDLARISLQNISVPTSKTALEEEEEKNLYSKQLILHPPVSFLSGTEQQCRYCF